MRVWHWLDPQYEPSPWHVRGDLLWGSGVKVLKQEHENHGTHTPLSNLMPIWRNPSHMANRDVSIKEFWFSILLQMYIMNANWNQTCLTSDISDKTKIWLSWIWMWPKMLTESLICRVLEPYREDWNILWGYQASICQIPTQSCHVPWPYISNNGVWKTAETARHWQSSGA